MTSALASVCVACSMIKCGGLKPVDVMEGEEDLLAEVIHRMRLAPVGETALLIKLQ